MNVPSSAFIFATSILIHNDTVVMDGRVHIKIVLFFCCLLLGPSLQYPQDQWRNLWGVRRDVNGHPWSFDNSITGDTSHQIWWHFYILHVKIVSITQCADWKHEIVNNMDTPRNWSRCSQCSRPKVGRIIWMWPLWIWPLFTFVSNIMGMNM